MPGEAPSDGSLSLPTEQPSNFTFRIHSILLLIILGSPGDFPRFLIPFLQEAVSQENSIIIGSAFLWNYYYDRYFYYFGLVGDSPGL